MNTYICTTGTSVAGKVRRDQDMTPKAYKDEVLSRVKSARQNQQTEAFLDAVSAETKSLRALKVSADDEIYLLHSETDDGRICAEVISEILQNDMNLLPTLKEIKGLQVHDAKKFRREGVNSLFQVLNELTSGKEYDLENQIILNITGGFKAVVPFVLLFGQLRRFDVAYIFERSSELIKLPPLPIQYDYERIKQALPAFQCLRENGVMAREDFFKAIPGLAHYDRRWYECLIEEDEQGDVTFSPIAQHLFETNEENTATIMIHKRAQNAYEKAKGSVVREQFDFILTRVGEPLWRSQKRHSFPGTDLEVYKPGNTAERIAGFLEGRTFYVCELFASHDNYEWELNGKKREQYLKKDFVEWVKPEDDETITKEELDYERLVKRYDKSKAELDECKERMDDAEEASLKLEMQIEELQKDKRDIEQALREKDDELARLRKPWWRRLFSR